MKHKRTLMWGHELQTRGQQGDEKLGRPSSAEEWNGGIEMMGEMEC
jgi:hypothetical protein